MNDELPMTPLTVAIMELRAAKELVLCDDTPETRGVFVAAWAEVVARWPPRYVSPHIVEYSLDMDPAYRAQLQEWIRTDPECAQAYKCDLAMLQDLYDEIEAEYLLEANGDSHD